MRLMRFAPHFVLTAAALAAGVANASPLEPRNGAEFTTLAAPQATQAVGKKVEVIEFFAYHCPACYALEPGLNEWVKKQGDNIVLRRVHLPFQGPTDPEAHLFLTLEAMGRLNDMHPKILHAVHVQRVRLMKDEQIIDWVSKNGIDRAKFLETWNSFSVMTKLRRLPQMATAYQVSGTPTIIVDGKYQTSPGQVAEKLKINDRNQIMQASFQVLDALVAKAAKTK